MTMKMACCLAAISIAVRVSAQNPDVPAKGAAAEAREAAKAGPDEPVDAKQFRLFLTYYGESDKPYYNLILSVSPLAVQNNPFSLFAPINEWQGERMIGHLKAFEFFKHAQVTDNQNDPKTGPQYLLRIHYGDKYFQESLGWDTGTIIRLDGFRKTLSGDAAKHMDQLLARLEGERKVWEWGEVVGGLQTTLSAEKKSFAAGQPIPIKLQLTNIGDQDRQYEQHHIITSGAEIIVFDEHGHRVPFRGIDAGTQVLQVTIKPAETKVIEACDLSSFYYLRRPGRYTVAFRGGGLPPSNSLRFEVTPDVVATADGDPMKQLLSLDSAKWSLKGNPNSSAKIRPGRDREVVSGWHFVLTDPGTGTKKSRNFISLWLTDKTAEIQMEALPENESIQRSEYLGKVARWHVYFQASAKALTAWPTAKQDIKTALEKQPDPTDKNQYANVKTTLLDVEHPDTWDAVSAEAQKRLHVVTQDLITIARDEARPVDVRRKAIFQLGKINDEDALEFLIKNITLYLPMDTIKGDEDDMKEKPCQYALVKSGNWRVGQLVLKSFDTPKSDRERMYLSSVLQSCLGQHLAKFAVEEQLFRSGRTVPAERKENLEAIRADMPLRLPNPVDDTPKWVDPDRPMRAVLFLQADDPKEQREAQEQLLKDRQNLISRLSAVISNPNNQARRPNAVAKAMAVLGELRGPESVEVLVTYIAFPYVKHPEARETPPAVEGGVFNKTIEQLLPAVPALINIGEPCVDEVIKKLATTDGGYEAAACEAVLKRLSQHRSVRSKLERALEQNKTPKRIHLENALKRLDEKGTRTQTIRQAELEVSVPEKTRQNEPTDLIIRLKNLGPRPVEFGHINGYRDCKIQIFDAAQRPCPYTAFGNEMMGGEDGEFKKFVLTPVDPGKSHEWRVDIAKCFQLKRGRYSIAVSLELNPATDAFKIVVDDVVFDVI